MSDAALTPGASRTPAAPHSSSRRELPLLDDQVHSSCVTRVPIFQRLTPEQQGVVASFARPITVAAGDLLHSAGDEVGQLFVVHTGRVKVVHAAPNGRTHLLRVVGPGEVVGEHAFLTGERPDYFVEAAEDAELCVFEHPDLARLVGSYPTVAVSMMRSLSDRVSDAERRVRLGAVDVVARLASYLLDLPVETSGGAHRVRLPLPKKDVASWLATTPESLSRALSRLARDGVIEVKGDEITLLDAERLEREAEG